MVKINKKILLLSIVSFIFAYLSGGNLPYSILYMFLIIIILGVVYMIIAKKNLYIKIKYRSRTYNVGDTGSINIVVENLGLIPIPYVLVTNSILVKFINRYEGDLIFLGPDKSKWIKNEITFTKRGVYNFGDNSLKISDLFNILQGTKIIKDNAQVSVYPKIYNLANVSLSGSDNYENLINSVKGIEDLALIKDIRKYYLGDNLKKVHWKLSAKHGQMYVKNLDTISGKECNMFINMNRDNLLVDEAGIIEEEMVGFLVSTIKCMLNEGIKTSLFIDANESKRINVERKEDFLGVMEYFLTQKSDGTGEFTNFIKSNLKHITRGNWIGIIAINVDDTLMETIINLKHIGYKVNVFYYGHVLCEIKNVKLLKNLDIQCFNFKEIISSTTFQNRR